VQVPGTKAYPILSSNTAPSCLGEFTARLTGQTLGTSSPDGLTSVVRSSSTSPNHVGQSVGTRITGILS
jgi:hypothetical protein